ncbi:MAG: glycosyltransferase family 4 protein [Rubrivivax sp.]|nr:glycosyltransferase family 4 protein [Rubrivivax sp.]
MRSLLFSTLYPSSARAGHGLFVETRLRKLLETGEVDTRVVAPVPWFPSTNPRFGHYAAFARTPSAEQRHDIDVVHPRYFLPPRVGTNVAPWLLARGAWRAVCRLRAQGFDFDLIDAHYAYPDGVAAALLARWSNRPFLVTARGSDINLIGRYRTPAAWMRWAFSRAAACIAVSEALAARMVEQGIARRPVHVLRNGVDGGAFRPVDAALARAELGVAGAPVLLTVGNLVPGKRQSIALEVLRDLSATHPQARLIVVGDGPQRPRLLAQAQQLGIGERVDFAGAVPQARLPIYYSAADVMLLPSEREGWPNVVLESLACGTPVVAARVGGVPEILSRPFLGAIIDSTASAEYARAVREVLARAEPADKLRAYALEMGWQGTSEAQVRLFREALAPVRH